MRWLVSLVLVAAAWLVPGLQQAAWAQTITECHPAATKGTNGPVDFGAYCWIDFSSLNPSQAENFGQDFQVNLPGGVATLTFTLDANDQDIVAAGVPSWGGAAFGNFAFEDIPGEPVLYQTGNGDTTIFTLTNVTLNANGTSDLPFVFVAADGESTNSGESLEFTTSGDPWDLVASPGVGQPGYAVPTLSYSNGNRTVLETGSGTGDTAGYVFTTDNSPGTVEATLVGSGLQGILFGLKYYTIGLSLDKTHVGDFMAGGTGTYTIEVTNTVVYPTINPPSELQPVRVVDTLPTGLTYAPALSGGSGWTCSADGTGQVVTCDTTSLQDLTTSKTFPPITIGVNVASDAPATLTNNVEVSDPTTSTLVFNVCETIANGICPNSATSTTGDPTNILRSDLSSSTKTVVDTNGGDAEAGDTLRYTITITESGGIVASGVSVVDDLAANLGGLSVVSIPAGSADASNPSGGVNGTGQLSITGISVPANGSVSIVFDTTISGSAGEGDEVDNTATINNPGGTGGTADAEKVIVLESNLPQPPGAKFLYLRDGGSFNTQLSRQRPTASGNYETINGEDGSASWELTPLIPNGETLELPTTVAGSIVMRAANNQQDRNRTVRAYLFIDRFAGPDVALDNDIEVVSGSGSDVYSYTFDLSSISLAQRTLNPDDALVLRIVNEVGQSNRHIRVYERDGAVWPDSYSFLSFDTTTVINVDAIAVHSQPALSGNGTKAAYVQGDHVYIRATVSDPFGTADISAVTVSITDPTGAVIASGAMTPLADTDPLDGSLQYEYDFNTVPTNPRLGGWTATVTAKEGVEDRVSDDANVGFVVHGKVSLGKAWGVNAVAGNAVSLTITGGATATAGSSTAPSPTVAATATSAAGTALTLAEVFTSGSAGIYSPSFACTRDKDSVAVAASGTGLSRTIVMPDDSAVTCAFTNNKTVPLTVIKLSTVVSDPVNDATNPKAIPGAVVEYQITVVNPSTNAVDADSVVITDPMPAAVELVVTDIGAPGSGPVSFTNGSPASGLTYAYPADVEFSTNGTTWTYVPTAGGSGTDPAVTHLRIRPKGAFNANDAQFTVKFRVKIK